MKQKRNQKTSRLTMFARIAAVMILLFVVGAAVSADVPIFTIASAGALLAVAPFAFIVPESLKASMTESELAGIKELGTQIEKHLNERGNGNIEEKDLNIKVKALWDDHVKKFGMDDTSFKKLQDTLKEQGIEIAQIKELGAEGKGNVKSASQQIHEWIKSQVYKDSLRDQKAIALEIKSATPMSAYSDNGGMIPVFPLTPELFNVEVDRRIRTARTEPNLLYPMLLKGNTNAAIIIWFNRKNVEGGAAFTPEYGLKPLVSWTYERKTAEPYKITVRVKISTEMMEDADFVEGEIRSATKTELIDKIDTALIAGTGIGQPEGVTVWASAYQGTLLDGTIQAANNADAIRAGILQLRNNKFTPDVLVISPTDKAVLDLTKNGANNYMKQEIDALLKGLHIIESTRINEGDFLLFDTSTFIVKPKGGMKISTGWGVNKIEGEGAEEDVYASDFEMNAVTIILEQRLYAYHDSINEVGALYDTFSVVVAALAIPVVPEEVVPET
jgi:HK97 family phage major capsid protein